LGEQGRHQEELRPLFAQNRTGRLVRWAPSMSPGIVKRV
jgi:hypothetical protein